MKSAPLPGTRASDDGSLCLEPPRRPAASRRPISPAVAARRREWNLSDLRWPLDTLNGTGFRDRFIIERRDTIASIDDIAGQIATLQHRPRAVDRERSDISSRLNLLEQARAAGDVVKPDRAAAIVTLFSSSDAKRCSGAWSVDGRTSCRAFGKTVRPGRPATHRCAATNGSEAFARSRRSSVGLE